MSKQVVQQLFFILIFQISLFNSQLVLAAAAPDWVQVSEVSPDEEISIYVRGATTTLYAPNGVNVSEYCGNINIIADGQVVLKNSIEKDPAHESTSNLVIWSSKGVLFDDETITKVGGQTLGTISSNVDVVNYPETLQFDVSIIGTDGTSGFGPDSILIAPGKPNFGNVVMNGSMVTGEIKHFKTTSTQDLQNPTISGFNVNINYAESLSNNPPASLNYAAPITSLRGVVTSIVVDQTDPNEAIQFVTSAD